LARERFVMAAGIAFRRPVLQTLYPELRSIPEPRWSEALGRAREGALDVTERIGVVGSIGVATYLLQWVDDGSSTALTGYLTQFILALPLVGVLVSPWHLRRTRRTLRNQAARFHGGESC
jgi:hypothetical protein